MTEAPLHLKTEIVVQGECGTRTKRCASRIRCCQSPGSHGRFHCRTELPIQMERSSQHTVILLVTLLVAASLPGGIVTLWFMPNMTADARAYKALWLGIQNGQYAEIERGASKAYALAKDPDLRTVSDFVARHANLAQRQELRSVDEAKSISGMSKAVFTAVLNPVIGIESLTQGTEASWGDMPGASRRVREKYFEKVIKGRDVAIAYGTNANYFCFFAVVCGYILLTAAGPPLREFLSPIKSLGLSEKHNVSKKAKRRVPHSHDKPGTEPP